MRSERITAEITWIEHKRDGVIVKVCVHNLWTDSDIRGWLREELPEYSDWEFVSERVADKWYPELVKVTLEGRKET